MELCLSIPLIVVALLAVVAGGLVLSAPIDPWQDCPSERAARGCSSGIAILVGIVVLAAVALVLAGGR